MFALSNGHIGLRGNLDEGEPFGLPGTYLNGFYETRPLPYAEAAYGNPEDGQTVVDVTNGKIIRLLVDDEPFDIRYGELLRHERRLDWRAGVLTRRRVALADRRRRARQEVTRLVSFTQRSAAAIRFEVEPLEGRCAWSSRASWSPTSPCPCSPRTRAPPPRSPRRWRPRTTPRTSCAPCSCTSPSAAACGWPPAWTT